MNSKFYARYIQPVSREPDQAAREVVLNYLLVAILVLSLVALADTAGVFLATGHTYLVSRILSNSVTVLFIAGLYRLTRYRRLQPLAAVILTLLIALFGSFVALQWGVLDPNGPILLSLAVVMAGILINARTSLYLAGCLAVVLGGVQYGETHNLLHPDLSWVGTKPTGGDVVGFSAMLLVIASVSWLYNRQMERALRRARRSEKALQRQKDLLEVKVQQRTRQLEITQLEQLQELYRFAELGRLSTALFHDLANHLTTVSVDIEGLKGQHQSGIMQRIQDNVRHVDNVVQRVRQQIQGKTTIETFSVLNEINEVIQLLSFAAAKAGVSLHLEADNVRPALLYKGDVMRFRQILMNLVSNGIEAYDDSRRAGQRQVVIRLARSGRTLEIRVSDEGMGITAAQAARIFEPFYSTKAKGVGIGLFIAKQVVEQDFGGAIELQHSGKAGTTFVVQLPRSYYARATSR